ncbi:MAG: hypothetical protein JXA54_03640 [Candidatus Heimdallarchaeota archaeon]|nr:hypothetical protein [Candidatus Heimdallarchaeota archaeon]
MEKRFFSNLNLIFSSNYNVINSSCSISSECFSISLTYNQTDLLYAIISAIIGFYLLIVLLIMKKSSFPIWVTRKTIHFLGGTYIAFIVNFISSLWGVILSTVFFGIVFLIIVFTSKLQILNEYFILKECRENERNFTFLLNTVSTLLSLLTLYIIFNDFPGVFMAGALIISWADTSGEVIGKNLPFIKYKIFNKKTISGTFAVFFMSVISFLITIKFCEFFYDNLIFTTPWFWKIIIGSALCTLVESFSWKWFDNILLPFCGGVTVFWLYFS